MAFTISTITVFAPQLVPGVGRAMVVEGRALDQGHQAEEHLGGGCV